MKRQLSSPLKGSEADALKISSEGEEEASVLDSSKVEPSGPERDVEGRDEGTLECKESAVDEVGRLTQIGLLSIDLGHCVGQSSERQKPATMRDARNTHSAGWYQCGRGRPAEGPRVGSGLQRRTSHSQCRSPC